MSGWETRQSIEMLAKDRTEIYIPPKQQNISPTKFHEVKQKHPILIAIGNTTE
ncbi:hypothetical protein L873DRAFT_1819197 [Choiromyces venosus 120613-1]|uniref:Uncharacterized protein n=1 Tax=Choiromyces venosus 120613-1 TaxID=1336337 RepID=A0A3N4J4M9_9PEZI|nr:hypothetical protein L873DRAFT_1819197 [Choiromyces venosus 120613-1]